MTETGVVIGRKERSVLIRMDTEGRGACEKCGIRGICSPGGRERVLELPASGHYAEGDKVSVEIREGRSILLAFLLFIVPLIVILGVYLASGAVIPGVREGFRILFSLTAAVLYFIGMAFLQGRLLQGVRIRKL